MGMELLLHSVFHQKQNHGYGICYQNIHPNIGREHKQKRRVYNLCFLTEKDKKIKLHKLVTNAYVVKSDN